jgi:hypothetical protein
MFQSAPHAMRAFAVRPLPENRGLAFPGDEKRGSFEITEAQARRFLAEPNPHGKPNSDVVRPWTGVVDMLRTPQPRLVIDFPPGMDEREAALYALPYAHLRRHAQPAQRRRRRWWLHGSPQIEMRIALAKRDRYIATPVAAHHRLFAWRPPDALPDHGLVVFARDDDWFFGVLHARFHEVWTRRLGTPPTGRCRYTPACFETFPFPWPPATPLGKLTRTQEDHRTAIAQAARALDAQRCEWLGDRADKKRTLTALYNARPAWLISAHAALDDVVAAAYGWPADLSDDETISRLLALNQQRSSRP